MQRQSQNAYIVIRQAMEDCSECPRTRGTEIQRPEQQYSECQGDILKEKQQKSKLHYVNSVVKIAPKSAIIGGIYFVQKIYHIKFKVHHFLFAPLPPIRLHFNLLAMDLKCCGAGSQQHSNRYKT